MGSYGDLMMDLSGGTRVVVLEKGMAPHVFERASYARACSRLFGALFGLRDRVSR